MYARVLFVGLEANGEASVLTRLRSALDQGGHATAILHPADGGLVPHESARSFVRSFRPSLVLWDLDSAPWNPNAAFADILRESGTNFACFSMSGREEGAAGPEHRAIVRPFRDDRYLAALTSSPSEDGRCGNVLLPQASSPARAEFARTLTGRGARVKSWHPSWGDAYADPALSAGAFTARHCSVCTLFDGPDAPTVHEAVLRMHERCALVVEDSLAARWAAAGHAALAAAVSKAPANHLAKTCLDLAFHEATRAQAIERQAAFLHSLPQAGEVVESLLDEIEKASGLSVRTQEKATKKIVLYGWFGEENFGDDLLLSVAAEHFQTRFPEAVILVIGGDAQRVRSSFGFEAASPDQRYLTRSFLKGACLIAFFGGLIFDDPTELTAGDIETFMNPWIDPAGQAAVCLTAWLYGVPQVYLCAGMGPLAKPAAQHAVRFVGLSGARFLLRDENSAKLAREAGVDPASIRVVTDLVMAAGGLIAKNERVPLPEAMPSEPYLTVSLRKWPLNPPDFERNIARALDQAVDETGLSVAFVPFDTEDVEIHETVFSLMKRKDRAVSLSGRPEPSQILSIVAHSQMAFAMRLHCSILHHVAGKPAIGLDYNDKIAAHFHSMRQDSALLPLTSDADRMARTVLDIAARRKNVSEDVIARTRELSDLANSAMNEAFQMVENHRPQPGEPLVFHPRGISKQEADINELHRQIDRLREENRELERAKNKAAKRAEALESSHSYRLGHALMRIPYRIKSQLRGGTGTN